jgi:Ca2+-binding RTX toxin-like protein
MSYLQDGSGYGIYAQRYDKQGAAVGGETLVNSTDVGYQQFDPAITALSDGGYVVTWMSDGQDGYSWGIYAQRYDKLGATVGGETLINSTAVGYDQEYPAITALSDGGYVVTWMSDGQDGSGLGIYAQRYNHLGATVGGETLINSTAVGYHQAGPAITALSDGGYVVTWFSFGQGSGYDIYAQRYNNLGATVGGETLVNSTAVGYEKEWPAIAALSDGGYVVTWMSLDQDGSGWGIYAQRYNSLGDTVGGETLINTTTANEEWYPAITGLSDGGYVVTWMSDGKDGYSWGIYAQRYDKLGATVGGETLVNSTAVGYEQAYPAITALSDGGYVVTWMSNDQDGFNWDIYAQRFDAGGHAVGSVQGDASANTLHFTGTQSVELLGAGGDDTLQGGNGNDVLDGGNGSDLVVLGDAQAALTWALGADGSLWLNGAGSGSDRLLSVEQVQSGDGVIGVNYQATENLVNTTTASDQLCPAITALSDGGYVVTWMSDGQDGYSWGIYAQRYDKLGATVGGETLVNSIAVGYEQSWPAIAALSDGGYVVTWTSDGQDGYRHGIYAQRYDKLGATVGDETLINSTAGGYAQVLPAITALSDGGYVVTWMSDGQDGSNWGIYAQRYNKLGAAVGGETLVNSTAVGYDQQQPAITALSDGGYVVTWFSYGQDGSGAGIYAQRYNNLGATVGGETLVNTTTANDQYYPAITALSDGGYVVTWMSDGQDGYSWGIYAQRYDKLGATVGGETLVNSIAVGYEQSWPAIAALSDGGYVVTWMSSYQDGYGNGIYAQRYDKLGATVGGETLINSTAVGYEQSFPKITALSDGGYVVTWMSLGQDGSGYGIYAQRFDANGLCEGHLTLTGGAENNVLRVSAAAEGVELIGGEGNDTLAGAAGWDLLSGGSGGDSFEFAASGNGVDRITDWGAGDRILVAGAAFAGGVTDGDGSTVGQNGVQVSHAGGQTWLHIGSDSVAGADVEIKLDGTWDTAKFVAAGNQISYPVNTAPTATHLDTAETYTEDTPLNLTNIVVADANNDPVTVTLTLSNIAAGALSTDTSNGVTSTYDPVTGVWSASGALADVNTLLAGVTFTPALNFHGTFTVATSVSDGAAPPVTGSKTFTGTPVNDAPTGGVSITGALVQGQVLNADTHTLGDVDGLGTLHYQWLRGGVAIAGAPDAAAYTTVLADVGATISLRVSYTDGDHTAESVLSPSTTIGAPLTPPAGLPTLIGPNQGKGQDVLQGTNQAEVLLGGTSSDSLNGGGGDDWLDGGAGGDTLSGGSGNDTYVVDSRWDWVNEAYGEGNDTVIASISYVLGFNQENLYLSGSAHINATGNADANLLIGNAGNNTLAGRLGNDTLIGGDGQDVFVFDTAPSATNRDTIHNFIVADDTIQLNRSVFSALTPGVLAPDAFVTGAAALDANDRIIYNSATGALLYDADGSGSGSAVQFATLVGVVGTLSAADFVVV